MNTNNGGMNRCFILIVLPFFGTWNCNQWFLRPPFPFIETTITILFYICSTCFLRLFCLVNDTDRPSFRWSQTTRAVAPGVIQSNVLKLI